MALKAKGKVVSLRCEVLSSLLSKVLRWSGSQFLCDWKCSWSFYIIKVITATPIYVTYHYEPFYKARLGLGSDPFSEPELSHKCEHPAAQIEAQLRGSSRIRAEPCSHYWLSSSSAQNFLTGAQAETSVKRLYMFNESHLAEKDASR